MRLLAPFLFIAIVLLVTIALDDTPPEADIVIVNRSDVFTLDPQRQSYIQDFRMTYALYEGLLRWNNDTFAIEPAVAVDLPEVTDGQRVFTFTLREEATWSNGDPVTAHDFAFALTRLLLPDTAADYSNLFFVIDGAREFWSWRSAQLAGFASDPFDDEATVTAEAVLACVHRLRSLLASDLPDGIARPLSADDVRRDLEIMEEAAQRESSALEFDIAGSHAVRDWLAALNAPASRDIERRWMWDQVDQQFAALVGVETPDDHTVIIRLGQPCAFFLDLACFGVCYPVHRPSVEGWPEDIDTGGPGGWSRVERPEVADCRWIELDHRTGRLKQRHEWARPGSLVGNGPFTLTHWRYKREIRLARNPLYWDRSRARSDTVLIRTIEDNNTRVLAFETGELHWLTGVGSEYDADMLAERYRYIDNHRSLFDELTSRGLSEDEALSHLPAPGPGERRNIHAFPTFGTDFYSFNCRESLNDGRPNPFADKRVRRAFALSIDKRPIVEHATRLREPILSTLIPPGSIPGYQSPDGLGFDVDRAIGELRDAGWTITDGQLVDRHGEPFPVVEILWTTNFPRYQWISLELKAQWETRLGVRIELRGVDTKFYKEDLKQGKFMIARGRWYGDYGDPTTFLDLCRSTDGNNDRAFVSERIDRMLDRAAAETDAAARMEILQECERILFEEEMPLLPLCQLVQIYMYEPGELSGLSHHPRLTQYLWQLESRP